MQFAVSILVLRAAKDELVHVLIEWRRVATRANSELPHSRDDIVAILFVWESIIVATVHSRSRGLPFSESLTAFCYVE